MGDPYENLEPAEDDPDVPEWDDEYLADVSDRLMFNYDLEKDVVERGEQFDMHAEMRMQNEKHFLHPALSFAHHESYEYLYARRQDRATRADLDSLVSLGHDLAEDQIEPDERHFSTEFVFVLVVEEIPDDVADFVADFSVRELLKYGYHGHYEIHLLVVNPEGERVVSSRGAHVEEAFRLWTPIEKEEPGLFQLLTRRLQL